MGDRIRKSGGLMSDKTYIGQQLSTPMRGTTQDLCSGLCVSNLQCDAWEYAADGTCTLKSLGDNVHDLIRQGRNPHDYVRKSSKKGAVSGLIEYEKRDTLLSSVAWIFVMILAILFILWLMGDCKK